MFYKIFWFEIRMRLSRPAIYLYFIAILVFSALTFASGSVPLGEKEHINAPYVIAFWNAAMSMMMMLVSSSIMGTALFRDIEYNTKDYYLTYPITKAGYFWGRFLSSFALMIVIASGIYLGVFIGTQLGPMIGWTDTSHYGPNKFMYYLHPFLTIALPNIFFTSALFFGLVAVLRNIKVIYFGGILLFLFYCISIFFLNTSQNQTVIDLADPFGLNGIRFRSSVVNSIVQNQTLFPVEGTFLLNRLIWSDVGLVVLLLTYFRFSFEKFFAGKRDKVKGDVKVKEAIPSTYLLHVSFLGAYQRKTLLSLIRVELLNIVRDNYFWIILGAGGLFLGFVFSLGPRSFGVPEFPRTVMLIGFFNDAFPFFLFFILLFYAGEIVHRDRLTRYAFINDSLPPPNRVMNLARIIALFALAIVLSLVPCVVGLTVQMLKGFHQFNFSAYAAFIFVELLPKLLLMVIFCYMMHVVLNNKFVAHAVAATLWVGVFLLQMTNTFSYNLLLYSYAPSAPISDMDGIGHMLGPVMWFNGYWLLFGGLLLVISALFFYRGVGSSLKERIRLVNKRFDKTTKWATGIFAIPVLLLFAYIYYNVSYLNNYLTKSENDDRAELYERTLKHFDSLPLPKLVSAKLFVDLYPEKQQQFTRGALTLVNKTGRPIVQMLVDQGGVTDYSLSTAGVPIKFSCPLVYSRGMFNVFRSEKDTADFRLYELQSPLMPNDSLQIDLTSEVVYKGFQNDRFAGNLLRNGTFSNCGLPGLGYDEDDEISSPYERKKRHLPEKIEKDVPLDDEHAMNMLKAGSATDLLHLDITVSTSADQYAIAPGELMKTWKADNRNFFRYADENPGLYPPFGIVSARFKRATQKVQIGDTLKPISIDILYHPEHGANISRFMAAYKDGLRYFSRIYGEYPLNAIRLAEASLNSPREVSMTSLDTYPEYNSWNAAFTDPNQFDYLYFVTSRLVSQQWWRYQVTPNATTGSLVIPEGLATYDALTMAERRYGKENMRDILLDQIRFYLFVRTRIEEPEHTLMHANQSWLWAGKAGVVLYGLRDLIGDSTMNAALKEFKDKYAFRSSAYPGSNSLFECLDGHVPDSLRYYMEDTWNKVTFYDNKITSAVAHRTGRDSLWEVKLTISVDKIHVNDKGVEEHVRNLSDLIDIGIFAKPGKDSTGRIDSRPLLLQKVRLTSGTHTFTFIVDGEPKTAGIDPLNKLIDRAPQDNIKSLEVDKKIQ
jgi:hypothetical protein